MADLWLEWNSKTRREPYRITVDGGEDSAYDQFVRFFNTYRPNPLWLTNDDGVQVEHHLDTRLPSELLARLMEPTVWHLTQKAHA